MSDRHPLDDAIDRAVRDMTHVAADDDAAVARVMARLRETDASDAHDASASKGTRWITTPRVAWCGAMVLLLMASLNMHSLLRFHREPETRRAAVTAPQASTPSTPSLPPLAAREFPTPVAAAPSTTQATTVARIAHRDTVRPSSVANGAADASERLARETRDAQPEPVSLESEITLASIAPAPLGDVAALHVAPQTTTALTVDEIPVASIEPPVSPEQHK
jgi:hypothetical protein